LAAILNLAFRPLTYANNSDNVLSLFVLNILSVPALVYQVRWFFFILMLFLFF
jgi:hypothetical protein